MFIGAKFGGYGSFLSMYQRSPVCSRPKTSPEVQQNQLVKIIKQLKLRLELEFKLL